MMRSLVHFAAFLLMASTSAGAQNIVLPPDLQCVKNDTIFWTPAANACGPFQGYLIFGSPSPAGPFNLIASVSDPAQTSYFHDTPGSQAWYYYMQSAHDCPGFLRLSSDTVSSLPPPKVVIASASVEGGQVLLRWPPSPAPQVDRYIIYRTTPSGTVPVDTVYGDTSYIDPVAKPGQQSETYYVVASDPCGNNSLFDILHQTVLLKAGSEACTRTISLSWNPYVNWPGGIDRQEVWLSVDGAPALPVDTLSASAMAYTFEGVDDQSTYCFTLRAYAGGSGVEARSNEVCLNPDVVQPPRKMRIKYVGVNGAQQPEIEWVWETYAELAQAGIFRSAAGGPFSAIQPVPVTPPLLALNDYTDAGTDAGDGPVAYRIEALDQCQQPWVSQPASPALLRAAALPGLENRLTWTPPMIEGAVIEGYEVFEVRGTLVLPLGKTDSTFFIHTLDAAKPPLEAVCYLVETAYRVTLPDGQERRISRSNTACASQEVRIWVPNAFAPRGINSFFRPLLVFADDAAYRLTVLDRWGGVAFRTEEPSEGWDGRIQGADAPSGVYVWQLELRFPDRKEVVRQGTVTLLR